MDRIVLVPRWGATARDDWYPWLRAEVDVPVAVVPLEPTPAAPSLEACQAAIAAVATGDLRGTLLVGHSVGCQVVMRFLAGVPPGAGPLGFLAVAGWFTLDTAWPTIRPWIDTPIDTDAVRRACPDVRLLLSDDDPFTGDHVANAALWRERLGAAVELVPGARHFNAAPQHPVLRAVRQLAG
ncbi:MAG: alpha/beta hydrolase [Alphaproteobacteria bacterium]|nr:alpha/beta hydrolase [Alphaproteobacteria bacterium]